MSESTANTASNAEVKPTSLDESASAPQDAPAAPMGDHCTSNPPLSWGPGNPSEQSSGEIVKLEDVEFYVSKPADVESQGTSLLLLLTNGAGFKSVNNQIQADHFAKEGYFVVMPDLFHGDPAPNTATVTSLEENAGILDQIKYKTVEGVKSFMIDMWLARHTPENTMPIIEKTLKVVKEHYGDKQYTVSLGTYAVGYCFGGKYALKLAATDEIIAAAVAHGTLITLDDIKAVKKPVTLACVENDGLFPDDIREEGRKFLDENKLENEVRVYKDAPHGFGVYGSYPDEHIKSAQREAFEQFIDFLSRH